MQIQTQVKKKKKRKTGSLIIKKNMKKKDRNSDIQTKHRQDK